MSKAVIETMYWLPYCSTCVKAEQALLNAGHSIKAHVNLKEESISRETLEKLAEGVGGVEALFSKRAMKYRSMGLDKMKLSDEDMLNHMQNEYTFIKRPVIVTDSGRVLAGFSAKQYATL
jgi:arsenate reductase (glutaredoxin)